MQGSDYLAPIWTLPLHLRGNMPAEELMKEIEQAKRYIISLKLQMGDLYSQLKDRESMINDLQAEINNLKGQMEGSINEPPSVA